MTRKSILLSGLYTVVVIAIITAVMLSTEISIPRPAQLITPVKLDPIPSDNCISCHTDEASITELAVMDRDGGHGGEGG